MAVWAVEGVAIDFPFKSQTFSLDININQSPILFPVPVSSSAPGIEQRPFSRFQILHEKRKVAFIDGKVNVQDHKEGK